MAYQLTTRQWELTHGPEFVTDLHGSGKASRLLADVCDGIVATLEFVLESQMATSDEILSQYPSVLGRCDSLDFEQMAQAAAYLILHLADRYCRVFQVLEELLLRGLLPVGKGNSFAAVDIGAGPGPGIFAARNFYAALSDYAGRHSGRPVSLLRRASIVEPSTGMARAMHYFAEHLIPIEQGRQPHGFTKTPASSPYADALAKSATPFGASHPDFSLFDPRSDHVDARLRLAQELEREMGIDPRSALRLAHDEIGVPSAYALALMTNFLTAPDAVPKFAPSLERLMRTSLVPGGILVVLGGTGAQYPAMYRNLDVLAQDAGLSMADGFEQPLQAGSRVEELETLAHLAHSVWERLASGATVRSDVQNELRRMGAQDIFDKSIPFSMPKFRVRVYRRGAWPASGVVEAS